MDELFDQLFALLLGVTATVVATTTVAVTAAAAAITTARTTATAAPGTTTLGRVLRGAFGTGNGHVVLVSHIRTPIPLRVPPRPAP